MVVRELITKLGFDIEHSKFQQFDRQVGLLKQKLEAVDRTVIQLGQNLQKMGRRLTLALSVPIALAGVAAVKASSKIETMALSFEVMLQSAEKGTAMLRDLLKFAATTPFQVKDIGSTAKQLLGMGIESEKLLTTMRFLGNVSAGLNIPIQRLGLNFGQVKSQGKLTGRELRDFAVGGVPLLETLADIMGKTKTQITAMVSEGKIGFPDVEKAFIRMTGEGGRFNNLMKRMSEETLDGLFSNFMDGLFLARAEIGKQIVSAFKLKDGFRKLNVFIEKTTDWFKNLSTETKRFVIMFTGFLGILGPTLFLLGTFIVAMAGLHKMLIMFKLVMWGAAGATTGFNASLLIMPILILAVIAVFAIFVDDVMVWIKGGDSLTGKLLGPWADFAIGIKTILTDVNTLLDEFFDSLFTRNFEGVEKAGEQIRRTLLFMAEDILGLENSLLIDMDKIEKARKAGSIAGQRDNLLTSSTGGMMLTNPAVSSRQQNITLHTTMNVTPPAGDSAGQAGEYVVGDFINGFNREVRHALSTKTDVED